MPSSTRTETYILTCVPMDIQPNKSLKNENIIFIHFESFMKEKINLIFCKPFFAYKLFSPLEFFLRNHRQCARFEGISTT